MKFLFLLLFLLISKNSISQETLDRPKLVVGIVVDQMRHDYLYKYYDKYSPNGFKKILTQGFSCENLHYNYIPTVTAPGHASIFTGATPALHGIIGNEWHVRYSRFPMYCVEDKTVQLVGEGSAATGQKSPVNLLASTITDELRLYFNNKSKVISFSIKDRGSILPGGHNPTGAYWYDGGSGQFVTSTYYAKTLPDWVKKFNEEKWPARYLAQGWNTLRPISEYTESYSDLSPYEGKLGGEKQPIFPRKFNSSNFELLSYTPYSNTMLTDLVLRAIKQEEIGKDKITDMLTISYSQPDYAGHMFGLQSVEVEDTYLRLDIELARMIDYLDKNVGKGQYIIFISADHGVAQVPQLMIDQKNAAGYFDLTTLTDTLKKVMTTKYDEYVIDGYGDSHIYLNDDRILFKAYNRQAIIEDIKSILRSFPGVANAFDRAEIANLSTHHPIHGMLQLGHNANRSGDIVAYLQPAWFSSPYKTGTTHSSPYTYDTHVPGLFYGWRVPAGKSYVRYSITDIAPTISHLIKIPLPNASIGKVVEFVK